MGVFDGMRYYRALAQSRGWTFWAGRTSRIFCPDHDPKPGHKMRLMPVKAVAS